jgi:acyl dehydratase
MVTSYQVRFTKPVYVPVTGSAGVTVSVTLQSLGEAPEESATLALRVTNDEGTTVLGKAIAVVSTL